MTKDIDHCGYISEPPPPIDGETEDRAWKWLDSKFLDVEAGLDPNDRDYSVDEMVDAFIAGALSTPSASRTEEWQPIETAPRDGTWILAAEDNGPDIVPDVYAASWISDGYWISKCGQYVTTPPEPTHWMHLRHLITSEPNNGE